MFEARLGAIFFFFFFAETKMTSLVITVKYNTQQKPELSFSVNSISPETAHLVATWYPPSSAVIATPSSFSFPASPQIRFVNQENLV